MLAGSGMEERRMQDQPDGSLSSSPCFAHELEQGDDGSFHVVDEQQRCDVMRWRKSEREKLIAARLAVTAERRTEWAAAIARHVAASHDFENRVVSFYWPFRGEPDLRPLIRVVLERGGFCALPVVVRKAEALVFRAWKPGEPLERGVWNIPVPASGEPVTPELVIAPVVGFDGQGFRLGYGGGFFDRTLAAMVAKPVVLGVGYELARIPTIFPQPHDIPMQAIVTQDGTVVTA
jgi:5-formyltetrahydrofolate cyclo-ligase